MPLVPVPTPPDDNHAPQDRGSTPPPPQAPSAEDPAPLASDQVQWRARALKAEEDAKRLEAELTQARATLDEARQQLGVTERRVSIQRELLSAGAVDLDATTLLVEQALTSDPAANVPAAVEELRARKPVLFGAGQGGASTRHSAMSGAVEALDRAGALAARARETGDRRLLMTYLRARRAR